MTVELRLSPELERLLIRKAEAAGKDVSTFVGEFLAENIAEDSAEKQPDGAVRRPGTFRERLESWIALHPVLDHAINDSRESIYEGRGE
jgi:hypothetical protein